jgi:uncharacterized membrane protein YkoI
MKREGTMHRSTWRLGLVTLVSLLVLAAARADEEKVPLDKLPKAVVDAVKAKFPGAELVSAGKEDENGQTVYEVAIKDKGQNIDVTFKPDGTLVSVEKEITVKDLPRAVAEALDARYPKATVKKTEEVTEGSKMTYEIHLVTADKKSLEVVFDPSGKVVEEENKDKKEGDKKD